MLSAHQNSYCSRHVNKKCFKPLLPYDGRSLKKIKYIINMLYRMWTTHHIPLDSVLFAGNGKLHAKKSEAHWYSKEDNHMMSFKLWLADNELIHFSCTDSNKCQLHKNTGSQWFSYIAKTKNLSSLFLDFLSWSPRVNIILCLSEPHMFNSV